MARFLGRNRWAKAGFVLACVSLVVLTVAPGIAGLAGSQAEFVLHALVAMPVVALAGSALGFVRRGRYGGDGRLGAGLGIALALLGAWWGARTASDAPTPARTLNALSASLNAGASVRDVLARVDEAQARAVGFAYVEVSGATEVLDDAGFFDAARIQNRIQSRVEGLRWFSHARHSAIELDEAARRLSAARQLWIIGRTMPGFLAIAVDLDGDGHVSHVSRIVGRSSS
jgi:hypothetical protein